MTLLWRSYGTVWEVSNRHSCSEFQQVRGESQSRARPFQRRRLALIHSILCLLIPVSVYLASCSSCHAELVARSPIVPGEAVMLTIFGSQQWRQRRLRPHGGCHVVGLQRNRLVLSYNINDDHKSVLLLCRSLSCMSWYGYSKSHPTGCFWRHLIRDALPGISALLIVWTSL